MYTNSAQLTSFVKISHSNCPYPIGPQVWQPSDMTIYVERRRHTPFENSEYQPFAELDKTANGQRPA